MIRIFKNDQIQKELISLFFQLINRINSVLSKYPPNGEYSNFKQCIYHFGFLQKDHQSSQFLKKNKKKLKKH